MKKLFTAVALIALCAGGYSVAMALNHGDEERIHHYEGDKVSTVEEAVESLKSHNALVAAILKEDKLNDGDLEKIHELSYSLENAIDELIAEKYHDATELESIDEAVQAVHNASENHEEEATRAWFAKLEKRVSSLGDQSQGQAETDALDKNTYIIVIKDHKFVPEEIRVSAGEKLRFIVDNQDSTPEEFESDDFRREKIIAGNSQATILVGPLNPGQYHFYGDFNMDTAKGNLIVE